MYFYFNQCQSMVDKTRNLMEAEKLLKSKAPPATFNSPGDHTEATPEYVPPPGLMPLLLFLPATPSATMRGDTILFRRVGKTG